MSEVTFEKVLYASQDLQKRRDKIKAWQWASLDKELKQKFYQQEKILMDNIVRRPKDHNRTMESIKATHRGLDAVEEYFNRPTEEDEIPF